MVLVFDPFAVLLMVCGNISIDKSRGRKKRSYVRKKVIPKAKIKKNKIETPTIKINKPTKKPEVTVDMSQFVDPNEIKNVKSKLKRSLQRRKS